MASRGLAGCPVCGAQCPRTGHARARTAVSATNLIGPMMPVADSIPVFAPSVTTPPKCYGSSDSGSAIFRIWFAGTCSRLWTVPLGHVTDTCCTALADPRPKCSLPSPEDR